VERWHKLDQTSQRQYQAGDISDYKATRRAMGSMAMSLERDPQLESILANRKREFGIDFDSGRSLGRERKIAARTFDDVNRFRRLQVFAADSTPRHDDAKITLARATADSV
jgi:hypothetical protein